MQKFRTSGSCFGQLVRSFRFCCWASEAVNAQDFEQSQADDEDDEEKEAHKDEVSPVSVVVMASRHCLAARGAQPHNGADLQKSQRHSPHVCSAGATLIGSPTLQMAQAFDTQLASTSSPSCLPQHQPRPHRSAPATLLAPTPSLALRPSRPPISDRSWGEPHRHAGT